MSGHHVFGPSGYARWATCHGAQALIQCLNLPEQPPQRHSAEGTAAHSVAELTAAKALGLEGYAPPPVKGDILTVDGFDIEVDEDMLDGATRWADAILACLAQHHGDPADAMAALEQRLEIPLPGYPGVITGTSDGVVITRDAEGYDVLWTLDYKYGRKTVSAATGQLTLYAVGAIDRYGDLTDIRTVHQIIVQPRVSEVNDLHTLTIEQVEGFANSAGLAAFTANALLDKPEAAILPHLHPSPDACQWCEAKGACPALARELLNEFLDETQEPPEPAPVAHDTPAERVAHWFTLLPRVREWCDKVEGIANALALSGHTLPGLKLVTGKRGNRKWRDEAAATELLEVLLGEEAFTRKLITPAQADKLAGKKGMGSLEDLTVQEDGKPTLAPESDKRPAISVDTLSDFEAE